MALIKTDINGLASDDSYWKGTKKEKNGMLKNNDNAEFMKNYQEELEKAMKRYGITVSNTTQHSSGKTDNGGMWYACWDGGNLGGHFITEKDFIPNKIIYSCPATICYFPDGTKTVVKCASDEEYVKEEGVMACIIKKLFSSRTKFKKLVESGYENQEAAIERELYNASFGGEELLSRETISKLINGIKKV